VSKQLLEAYETLHKAVGETAYFTPLTLEEREVLLHIKLNGPIDYMNGTTALAFSSWLRCLILLERRDIIVLERTENGIMVRISDDCDHQLSLLLISV
jgi:hypothetical protein